MSDIGHISLLESNPLDPQHSFKLPHLQSTSVNDVNVDTRTEKKLKTIAKIGGFYGASTLYKTILGLYMVILIAFSIIYADSSICLYLNVYVTLCHCIGLVCYIFGISKINLKFIHQTAQHISYLDSYSISTVPSKIKKKIHIFTQFISGKSILNREIFLISFLFVIPYVSALIVVFDLFQHTAADTDDNDGDNDTSNYIIIIISDFIDFLRYVPSAIFILFIRLYFNTFSSELTAFRQKYGIITRFEKTDDIEVQKHIDNIAIHNQQVITVINEKKENIDPNMSGNTNKNKRSNYSNISDQKHVKPTGILSKYLVKLNMSHFEFKNELETIIFPYRNMARHLRDFIIVYLGFNALCFIFVLITTLKGFTSSECDAENIYYLHYVTEMTVYFIGWIILVIPLAESHRKLRSLNRDIKSKIIFNVASDQILVHQYLDSVVDASPFSIGYIKPTYSKISLVFYVLFSIVGGQLLSFFVYNHHH